MVKRRGLTIEPAAFAIIRVLLFFNDSDENDLKTPLIKIPPKHGLCFLLIGEVVVVMIVLIDVLRLVMVLPVAATILML